MRSPSSRAAAAVLVVLAAPLAATAVATAQGDGDGVLDLTLPVQDLSLNTASLDESLRTAESNDRIELTLAADVLFRFDSAALTGGAQSRIAEAAAKIEEREPPSVRVTGHTDAKGSDAYNLALSRRRAVAVAAALRRELGAAAPPLRTRGRGESDPVAANTRPDGSDNPRGRARNRRVTIAFPR